jgi:hypothetical protein
MQSEATEVRQQPKLPMLIREFDVFILDVICME